MVSALVEDIAEISELLQEARDRSQLLVADASVLHGVSETIRTLAAKASDAFDFASRAEEMVAEAFALRPSPMREIKEHIDSDRVAEVASARDVVVQEKGKGK